MYINLALTVIMALLTAHSLATPKAAPPKSTPAAPHAPTRPPEPFSIVAINLSPDMSLHQLQHDLAQNGYRLRAESPTHSDSFLLELPPKPSAAARAGAWAGGAEMSKGERTQLKQENERAIRTSEQKLATCKLAYNNWDKQCVSVWSNPKCIAYRDTFDKAGCRVFGVELVPSVAQRKNQMDRCKGIGKDWGKKCVKKWNGGTCNRWQVEAFQNGCDGYALGLQKSANAEKARDKMCKDTVKGWEKSCIKKWNGKDCPFYKVSFIVNKCKGVLKASSKEPME
ncbi:hypothetical protein AOQ84DRAFT_196113 [Glonium stellatum]|uniref:Uncharacterized protein n=1 Tax=Glonium stellatum TaxID=574774 RepID=A0A8E2F627_9PEZI|nr:hypothetical protein AOQ84DRAFT_196113 [Glonium stellatum]